MKKPSILPRFGITTIDSASSEVADTRLAATIYAFGVPLRPENRKTVIAGEGIRGIRVIWNFYQPDPAGNSPKEIARLWLDSAWQDRNPSDPLTVCKRSFDEYEQLKRCINLGRGYSVHNGPCVAITNTRKASVLKALGHPILGWRRNDRVTTFCFHEAAAVDAALYDDPTVCDRLPDAAISYGKASIENHRKMVDEIFEDGPQYAQVQHKGRTILIGRDAPKSEIEKIEKIGYRR